MRALGQLFKLYAVCLQNGVMLVHWLKKAAGFGTYAQARGVGKLSRSAASILNSGIDQALLEALWSDL